MRNIVFNKFIETKQAIELDFLNDYKFIPMPEPPTEIVKYAQTKLNDLGFKMKENYFRRPDLYKWLCMVNHWQAKCLSNFEWLQRLYKKHKNEMVETRIKEYLNEFEPTDKWWMFGQDFIEILAGYSIVPLGL